MRYLIVCLLLLGCKTPEVSSNLADSAKEQVQMAYNNLPKECKSPEREREFNSAISQIDNIVASCEVEKQPLKERLRTQTVISFGLGFLSLLLFLGLIRKKLV